MGKEGLHYITLCTVQSAAKNQLLLLISLYLYLSLSQWHILFTF